MRQNGRLGGIGSVVLMAVGVLLWQAFGFSAANAQRKLLSDDIDRELFKSPAVPRVQEPAPSREQTSRTQSKPGRGLTGSPVSDSGTILTTDVVPRGPLVAEDGPPNRPFTLASSVGTVDEDSIGIVQFRNFTVSLLPAATGSVHIRYNITAVDDISSFCPASQSVVRVRFRNGDDSGATAQVSFDIHQTNITSGGNNIIYSFNSNGRGAGTSFITISDSPAIDFDFANNIYWIEATIFRSNTSLVADLGSIQIWEAAGTACP
jgi:hypothetical protein